MPSNLFIGTELVRGCLDLYAGEKAWWLLRPGWNAQGYLEGRAGRSA